MFDEIIRSVRRIDRTSLKKHVFSNSPPGKFVSVRGYGNFFELYTCKTKDLHYNYVFGSKSIFFTRRNNILDTKIFLANARHRKMCEWKQIKLLSLLLVVSNIEMRPD